MHHIDTFFDDPYLRAGHLAGEVHTVTIKAVRAEMVGREEDKRPVIYFAEFDKGMVCNKTNARRIVALYGGDTDTWPGCRLLLYPTTCEMGGEEVDCIRVKPQAPPAPSAPRRKRKGQK